MTLTLLLDLDDTLLSNKMDVFIPAYLKALSGHLTSFANPDRLVSSLLSATQKMVQNQDPTCTLREVFDEAFYPALSIDQEELLPEINQFYAEIFPKLRSLTTPVEGAKQVVDEALQRGYLVAIATNPLFPRTAIAQRLSWAGIDPESYPNIFIPSYETFHFAKPNPAYFMELLAHLSWPEGPVLMVGDDLQLDIRAAAQAGLATYWINNDSSPPPINPKKSGNLSGLLGWLDIAEVSILQPDYDSPIALLATLRSTPAVIQTLSKILSTKTWTERPQPDEWCLTEICCHLRDVEAEVNLPRISLVNSEENPFIPGKDTDPWAGERAYIQQDGLQALQAFTHARQKMLFILETLPPEGWHLPARHAIFGPTNLQELVTIIAGHDRLHVQQVIKCLQDVH